MYLPWCLGWKNLVTVVGNVGNYCSSVTVATLWIRGEQARSTDTFFRELHLGSLLLISGSLMHTHTHDL